MRIVFDHQCFQDQAEGGVSRYVVSLVAALRARPGVDVAGWAGWHQGRAPGGFGGRRIARRWLEGMGLASRLARLGNAVRFSAWARGVQAEVYHASYYRSLRVPEEMARVVTAHDCIHERFPGTGGNELAMKRVMFARADHVICISECTRADVIRFYGVPEAKVTVVYHGGGFSGGAGWKTRELKVGGRPYVLYVGKRGGYKNFEVLRRLWAADRGLREACDLVCVGGERGESRCAVEGIKWVEPASDTELVEWYEGALALVYASKYEGFGLPVLEARSAGCPVVTTRGGAIPEVAGEAALYCDADEPREWGEVVGRLLKCDGERAEWAARGRSQASKFSWARCAEGTVAAYSKALAVRDRRMGRELAHR